MTPNLIGQTDRPCGAPLLPVSDCNLTAQVLFTGTNFQAGDAPLPVSCPSAFSNDAWIRITAPSPELTISFINRSFLGSPASPHQATAFFYVPTPDCNNLVNVGDCPNNCPLALACITLDGMEGHSMSRRYTGLTAGVTYYMRVLWTPSFTPAPDTLRVSAAGSPCTICDPCEGVDFVLPTTDNQLTAKWIRDHVNLQCGVSEGQKMNAAFWRSKDALQWEELPAEVVLKAGQWTAEDHTTQAGQRYFYRARLTSPDGNFVDSDIAEVQAGSQPWLNHWTWQDENLLLDLTIGHSGVLQIFDIQGSLLSELPVSKQDKHLSVPVPSVGNGVYILNLTGSPQAKTVLINHWQR